MKLYIKNQHHFFDNLVSFISSLCCLGIGLRNHHIIATGTYPEKGRLLEALSLFYNKDRELKLQGISTTSNLELIIKPYELLNTLASNTWPNEIRFDESQLSDETKGMKQPVNIPVSFLLHSQLIKAVFIAYYEQFSLDIKAKYGRIQNWPSVWNFGRVIRNAFVHNGIITIRDPKSPPVAWGKLSYSAADNGKSILYVDLAVVEIILLMEEMDSHL
jgi:hypothetical protein